MKGNAMKKILMLLLTLLLLTGCGKQEIPESTQLTEETVATVQTESSVPTAEAPTVPPTTLPETIPTLPPEPESDEVFVRVLDYIPTAVQELRYATEDNFTGQVIYESADAYLRYGTVKRLMVVQNGLKPLGYKLLIWDSYRPVEAQFKLWEICPDSTYVANPNKGYSSHSRGNTIDVSIVTLAGKEVEMPTGFDDFSVEADRDYSDVSQTAAENALMLEQIMEDAGFRGYSGEWWHYTDTTDYPVIE